MALKKRFREAARNELRFFFFAFVLFLVVLMIVTTVATSLYLYFSSFVPSLASYGGGSKSCDMLSRKQILFDSLQKSLKSPVHLFELNFLHSMIYTIFNLPYVLSFLI